jgi:serine/threonine protein kinase/Tfp pilus assembly protein PilF
VIGKTLAHYKITRLLGEGGMGVVYEAEDTRLKRKVALKILADRVARDPRLLERFQREAEALATLNHPNIVTVHSVETADGMPFFTMELVEGKRLDEVIPTGGMALDGFFDLALPLTEALSTAHEMGVTHRDLKPANIIVGSDGRPKILDFGLAKLEQDLPPDEMTMDLEKPLTEVGSIVGTAPYMSPEQLEGGTVDARSDIFSLGILMYEMLTGERPFQGQSSMAVMSSVLKDQPRQMSELKADLPRHLDRIVSGCLEKKPDHRHQTAKDVRNNLRQLHRELETESTIQSSARPKVSSFPPPWSRVATAGLVIAIAVVGYLLLKPGEKPAAHQPVAMVAKETPPPGKRRMKIVVLPFENLGASDDEYFADGLTEEITSRLSAIKSLGVISRTSAMQYKEKRLPLKEIGQQLMVDYVLEGTVRWQRTEGGPSRIRVTPQLIRVSDDTHMWSSSYSKELSEIFAVQSEIAENVARALNVTLGEPEKQAVAAVPTDNMEAYQAYLRGLEIWHRPGYDVEDFRMSAQLMERALELDPEFVPAMTVQANVYSMLYLTGDETEAILDKSKTVLQRATALEPNNPEVRLAWGYYYYLGFFDYEKALVEMRAAENAAPNNYKVYEAIAYVVRRQGHLPESTRYLTRAVDLDPQNAHLHLNVARNMSSLQDFATADHHFDQAILYSPDGLNAYSEKAFNMFSWKGDVAAARAVLNRAPRSEDPSIIISHARLDLYEQDFSQGIARLEKLNSAAIESADLRVQYLISLGFHLHYEGRLGEAERAFEAGLELSRQFVEDRPRQFDSYLYLARCETQLGNLEAVPPLLEKARELGDVDKYFRGPWDLVAINFAIKSGDPDLAVATIRQALANPVFFRLTPQHLKMDPMFDPLRDHPGFQELLEE